MPHVHEQAELRTHDHTHTHRFYVSELEDTLSFLSVGSKIQFWKEIFPFGLLLPENILL
jgi:hypothetical protein